MTVRHILGSGIWGTAMATVFDVDFMAKESLLSVLQNTIFAFLVENGTQMSSLKSKYNTLRKNL